MIGNLSRRGSGGRGFISGAGETELQLQRRRCASYFWCPSNDFFLDSDFSVYCRCFI